MSVLILMEGVNTIVPIQLVATIVHVLLVILLMKIVTDAQVKFRNYEHQNLAICIAMSYRTALIIQLLQLFS